MPRPPAVTGGRPNQITVRLSDSELAELDRRRQSLNRPDYLRRMALDVATVSQRAALGAHPGLSTANNTSDDPPEGHRHTWAQKNNYLDECVHPSCTADRPHQAGTR